jgi:hypothetical protein
MTLDRNDDRACGSDFRELSQKLRAVANDVRHLSKDRTDFPEKMQTVREELDFIISSLRHTQPGAFSASSSQNAYRSPH